MRIALTVVALATVGLIAPSALKRWFHIDLRPTPAPAPLPAPPSRTARRARRARRARAEPGEPGPAASKNNPLRIRDVAASARRSCSNIGEVARRGSGSFFRRRRGPAGTYDEPRGISHGARVALGPGLGAVRARAWLAWPRRRRDGPPHRRRAAIAARRGPTRSRPAASRPRRRGLGPREALGVRALDLFTPCCEGQRMGIFAGSGVGKSTLLSMITAGRRRRGAGDRADRRAWPRAARVPRAHAGRRQGAHAASWSSPPPTCRPCCAGAPPTDPDHGRVPARPGPARCSA